MVKAYQAACVQMASELGDKHTNLSTMRRWVQKICGEHPNLRLVVFPELVTTGFILGEKACEAAELHDGEHLGFISKLAAEYQVHIVYGYVERGAGGGIYDSQQLVSDQGKPLLNYRKIHLTEFEKSTFSAGHELAVVDTALGKIGMQICWDLAFPELSRLQALQGCDLLVASSAWESPYAPELQKFSMARAIDNTLHLVVSNSVGECSGFNFSGHSGIYDPTGEALSQLQDQAGYSIALIDPIIQRQCRNGFFSMLKERRLDVYSLNNESDQ